MSLASRSLFGGGLRAAAINRAAERCARNARPTAGNFDEASPLPLTRLEHKENGLETVASIEVGPDGRVDKQTYVSD